MKDSTLIGDPIVPFGAERMRFLLHFRYQDLGNHLVISGQDVVEANAAVDTGYHEQLDAENVPLVPVKILSASVMEPPH